MKKITFNYSIFCCEESIYNGQIVANLSDEDLAKVAETMVSTNGGFPCPMETYSQLTERLWDIAAEDYENVYGDVDWEEVYLSVDNEMPKELVNAVNPFVARRTVTIPYYTIVAGKESRSFVAMEVNREVYESMLRIAKSEHGLTDFEELRKESEVLYHGIIYDMSYLLEGVENEGDDFVILKEFPHEVYENI